MKKEDLLKMLKKFIKELEEEFNDTEFTGLFPVLKGLIRSCEVHFRECEGCGTLVCEYNATRDADRHYYCPKCVDEHLMYCYKCGKYHRKNSMVLDEYLELFMCSDCYRERYYRCNYCSDYVYHDEAFWHDGIPYCNEICCKNMVEE